MNNKLHKPMLSFFKQVKCVLKELLENALLFFMVYLPLYLFLKIWIFHWCHFLSFWRTSSTFCIDGGLVIILLAFFYLKMLLFHLYYGRMLFYFLLLWASSEVLIFFPPSTFKSVFTLSLASIVSDKSQNLES